jgi:hypothetical protein
MSQQRWKVSIAIHGIVANYNAVVSANSEEEAEEKVREMYAENDLTNGEISEAEFINAYLSDSSDDKFIEDITGEEVD